MAEVQQYGNLKVDPGALPAARVDSNVGTEAFGGGPTTAGAFAAAGGLAKEAGDLAEEHQKQADQVAFMSADSKLAQKQTEIHVNVSKMRGQNALGAADYAKSEWDKYTASLIDGTQNRAQQMALRRSSMSRFDEINKATQVHTGNEMESFADNETKGYVQNATNLAVLNPFDNGNIQAQRERVTAAMQDQANRKGIPMEGPEGKPSEQYQMLQSLHLGQFDKAVIQSQLDKDDAQGIGAAKNYLEAHKGEMDHTDYLAARGKVENSETKQLGMSAWEEMKGLRLSDGTPNVGAMEKQILADDSLPVARKMQIVQFVKARAGEDRVQFYQQTAANDQSFANQVVKARTQGMPMTEAMKLVDDFSRNPVDRQAKMSYVQSTYAPPSESDVDTKVNLRERIEQGTATLADIESARGTLINDKDYMGLRQEYFKAQVEGHTPQMKLTNNQIGELAQTTFGSDRTRINRFKDAVNAATMGMSPDEKYKTATDMIKKEPKTQWHFLGIQSLPFGGEAAFETASKQNAANAIALGQASQDVGHDAVVAIGQGLNRGTGKALEPIDIDNFAKQLGVPYDQLKKGTPYNNAIQSIMQAGQVVTPEGVKFVLARAKNGKLPPPSKGGR